MRSWLVVSCAVLAVVGMEVWSGCSGGCSASNCTGCCDSTNTCQSSGPATCGINGVACVSCSTIQSCNEGVCTLGEGNANGNATGPSGPTSGPSTGGSTGNPTGTLGSTNQGTQGTLGQTNSGGTLGQTQSTGTTGNPMPDSGCGQLNQGCPCCPGLECFAGVCSNPAVTSGVASSGNLSGPSTTGRGASVGPTSTGGTRTTGATRTSTGKSTARSTLGGSTATTGACTCSAQESALCQLMGLTCDPSQGCTCVGLGSTSGIATASATGFSTSGGSLGNTSTTGSTGASFCQAPPPFTTDNGNVGKRCQEFTDGGPACAAGLTCELFGGPNGTNFGMCMEPCTPGSTICPGSSLCIEYNDGSGTLEGLCSAICRVGATTPTCVAGEACNAITPNPADPGICIPECATVTDCGSVGTCTDGICKCTSSTDCANLGETGFDCETATGACYQPCTGTSACETGSCCVEYSGGDYCDPAGGS